MMKALKKKRKGGFTLIELIVVIAILGILAAIAIPRFANVSDNAAASAEAATIRTVNSAYTLFLADTTPGVWPTDYVSDAVLNADGTLTIGTGANAVTLTLNNTVWED